MSLAYACRNLIISVLVKFLCLTSDQFWFRFHVCQLLWVDLANDLKFLCFNFPICEIGVIVVPTT